MAPNELGLSELSPRSSCLMAISRSPSIRGAAWKWLLAAMLGVSLAAWRPALADDSVSFPSLDGPLTGGKPTLLRGLLMKPEGIGPFPAIVALHGCNGLFNKEGALVAREAAWAQTLTSHGYVVLFPDSFGPRDVATDCEGRVRAWAERSYDAYGALRYLQAQSFVIGERIGVMGWSHGGGAVIFAIAPNSIGRWLDRSLDSEAPAHNSARATLTDLRSPPTADSIRAAWDREEYRSQRRCRSCDSRRLRRSDA